MAKVVDTAGKVGTAPSGVPTRRDMIREVRKILRDPTAPEDVVDDALEALLEMSKE